MSECLIRSYPFGTDHTIDLEPDYRTAPVSRVSLPSGADGWLVTSHECVKQVLQDPMFSREAANQPHVGRVAPELLPPMSILANDPPIHTQLRRRIAGMFTPRRAADLRPVVEAAATDLLTDFAHGRNAGDLLAGFVEPYAREVVCELLAVPKAVRPKISELGEALAGSENEPDVLIPVVAEFEELVRDIVGSSTNDLFAQLGESPEADAEIVNLFVTLLAAGRRSPMTFLSSAFFILLRTPEYYRHLVDHPETMASVTEELLRYVPVGVGGGFTRVALQDTQLGGVDIRAGDALLPAMHAANRDPAVFDRPEELVFERESNPHFGLGHGSHYCIGASLSRMEIEVALRTVTEQMPKLALAVPAQDAPWQKGRLVRVLDSLEVTW